MVGKTLAVSVTMVLASLLASTFLSPSSATGASSAVSHKVTVKELKRANAVLLSALKHGDSKKVRSLSTRAGYKHLKEDVLDNGKHWAKRYLKLYGCFIDSEAYCTYDNYLGIYYRPVNGKLKAYTSGYRD